jgi:hypothetical protein
VRKSPGITGVQRVLRAVLGHEDSRAEEPLGQLCTLAWVLETTADRVVARVPGCPRHILTASLPVCSDKVR